MKTNTQLAIPILLSSITLGVIAIGVTLFVWQNQQDTYKFSNGEVLPIKETDAALGILHSPTYSIPKDVSPKPLDEAMIRRLFSHFADQELPGTLGKASGYAYDYSWGVPQCPSNEYPGLLCQMAALSRDWLCVLVRWPIL